MFYYIKISFQKSLLCFALALSIGSGVAQASEDQDRDYFIQAILSFALVTPTIWNTIANAYLEYLPDAFKSSDNSQLIVDEIDNQALSEIVDDIARSLSESSAAQNPTLTIPIETEALHFENGNIQFLGNLVNIEEFTGLFFQQAEYQHWIMPVNADMQVQMILMHLMSSNERISFDCLLDACREIYFRLYMISEAELLACHTAYNTNDDSYKFNSETGCKSKYWISISCKEKKGNKFNNVDGSAFSISKRSSPFRAIQSCYSGEQLLDCAGFTVTHAYGSLAMALGEEDFNSLGSDFIVIAPYHVCLGKNGDMEIPIIELGILEEPTIESLDDLLPGDIIYFENFPNYGDLCDDLKICGFWSGEYCIYMGKNEDGDQMFMGLGLAPQKASGIIEALSQAYISIHDTHIVAFKGKKKAKKDLGKIPYKANNQPKGWTSIIGGVFPGPRKHVLCLYAFRSGGYLSKNGPFYGKK